MSTPKKVQKKAEAETTTSTSCHQDGWTMSKETKFIISDKGEHAILYEAVRELERKYHLNMKIEVHTRRDGN